MIVNGQTCNTQSFNIPFLFRKRNEKVDWKRLASVDVDHITNQLDVDALQEILVSVTFCDIKSEIDTRHVDSNLIKLFQLAQLLIEYLLHSQNFLTNTVETVKTEKENLQKQLESLHDQLIEKNNRLTAVRRECRRRRLLLLAQQQLMDAGPQSYHRCSYCPKAFLNASFLASHVQRRHSDAAMPPYGVTATGQAFTPQPSGVMQPVCPLEDQNANASLQRDVRQLLNQLQTNQLHQDYQHDMAYIDQRPASVHRSSPSSRQSSPRKRGSNRGSPNPQNLAPEWYTTLMEEHRRDMEILRMNFDKELHDLQIQHANTQAELEALKANTVASRLGDMVDDISEVQVDRKEMVQGSGERKKIHMVANLDLHEAHTHPQTSLNRPRYDHPGENHCDQNCNRLYSHGGTKEPGLPSPDHSVVVASRHVHGEEWRSISQDVDQDRAEPDVTLYQPASTSNLKSTSRRHYPTSNAMIDDRLQHMYHIKQRHRGANQRPHSRSRDEQRIPRTPSPRTRHRRKLRQKRIRSTAIQVGGGGKSGRNKSSKGVRLGKDAVLEMNTVNGPVFLKVKRPYSRSVSSGSLKSVSPKARCRLVPRNARDNLHEIIIVRTDDEDGRTSALFDDRSGEFTQSLVLMPTVATNNFQREHVNQAELAGETRVNLSTLHGGPVARLQEGSISPFVSGHGTERSQGYPSSKLSRSGGRVEHEQRQRRAAGRTVQSLEDLSMNLHATHRQSLQSVASSPVTKSSTGVVPYNKLMDELLADTETLQGLRHEVKQLLLEQLAERGVTADQTRLSTVRLNELMPSLLRDRDSLALKHPTFMEIRQVDRVARSTLHDRSHAGQLRSPIKSVSALRSASTQHLPPPGLHSPGTARRFGSLSGRKQTAGTTGHVSSTSMPSLTAGGRTGQLGYSLSHSTDSSGQISQLNEKATLHHQPIDTVDAQYQEKPHSFGKEGWSESTSTVMTSTKPLATGQETGIASTNEPVLSVSSLSPKQPVKSPSSPVMRFSQDHKVVTFDDVQFPQDKLQSITSSGDEWDSDSEVEHTDVLLRTPPGMTNTNTRTGNDNSLLQQLDHELDSADALLSNLQQNTNAIPYAANQTKLIAGIGKTQSIRTDDEEVFSISSINGDFGEDISLSLPGNKGKTVSQTRSHPETSGDSRAVPFFTSRPPTRFGRGNSIGSNSFDAGNGMATSLWGTNSKDTVPTTSVSRVAKSENLFDDLESDY